MLQHNTLSMINIAVIAARKGGSLIIQYYNNLKNIKKLYQEDKNKILNKINRNIKTTIITIILKAYPKHTIIDNCNNLFFEKNNDIQWIINPLDGINNFFKQSPHFAISITIRIKNNTAATVVYDPMRDELFSASKGYGAQLNSYRLRNYSLNDKNNLILATDFALMKKKLNHKYVDIFNKIFTKYVNIRCTGSIILDLAYVAAERFDGFFGIGLESSDVLSGELLIRESGGFITDFNGNSNYILTGRILAGSSKFITKILTIIKSIN